MTGEKTYEFTAEQLIEYATDVALASLRHEHKLVAGDGSLPDRLKIAVALDRIFEKKLCHAFAVDLLDNRIKATA